MNTSHKISSNSFATMADAIVLAHTFNDLEMLRREFKDMTGLSAEEQELLEIALAGLEHDLIEWYRIRR